MIPAFRTLSDIIDSPWEDPIFDPTSSLLPPKNSWNKEQEISLDDVKIWEQIYFHKGTVGIYAAWDPYDNYYIIIYNLFASTKSTIEEFRGKDAENQVLERAKDLGIDLPLNRMWV